MKTRTKVVLGALASGVLIAGTLVGSGETYPWRGRDGGGGPGMMMGPARQLFDRADGDRDGTLTRAELDGFVATNLEQFDANADGRLALEEFQGLWVELTRPLRVRAFQFVDGDGDGALTATELEEPLDHMMERLDRNDDGALARDELSRAERGSRHD
jgi:hypothetical protein